MKKLLLSCFITLACVNSAFAWHVQLDDIEYMPSSMVVVDKGAQNLSYLEKHSPLSTVYNYPSIHGEIEGDKEFEGDLKTPEGIYFVTTKIYMPLDFEKYGSQAHALNYPNPVDRLREKTGGGIWIHSKGNPIASQKTQGCIAIDLDNIAELAPHLKPGTPVMVAQNVFHASANQKNLGKTNPAELNHKTSRINSPHKSALNEVDSTDTENHNTKNIQSLENTPQAVTIQTETIQNVDNANRSGAYASTSSTDNLSVNSMELEAITAIADDTQVADDIHIPKKSTETNINAETSARMSVKTTIDVEVNKNRDSTQMLEITDLLTVNGNIELQKKLFELTQQWNNAWQSRSNSFFDFYDTESYSKAQGEPFKKFYDQKKYLFKNMNWIHVNYEKIKVLQGPGYWVTWFNQYYRSPTYKTEGIRRLYWQVDKNGDYKIVGMEWLPRNFGFENTFIENTNATIPNFVEAWRLAWKNADSKNYATFYTQNARQDSIKTIDEIIARKNSIWELKKPVDLELSRMAIDVKNDAVYVKMVQKYSDTSGYTDTGVKTLVLYPHGSSWLIAHERWAKN